MRPKIPSTQSPPPQNYHIVLQNHNNNNAHSPQKSLRNQLNNQYNNIPHKYLTYSIVPPHQQKNRIYEEYSQPISQLTPPNSNNNNNYSPFLKQKNKLPTTTTTIEKEMGMEKILQDNIFLSHLAGADFNQQNVKEIYNNKKERNKLQFSQLYDHQDFQSQKFVSQIVANNNKVNLKKQEQQSNKVNYCCQITLLLLLGIIIGLTIGVIYGYFYWTDKYHNFVQLNKQKYEHSNNFIRNQTKQQQTKNISSVVNNQIQDGSTVINQALQKYKNNILSNFIKKEQQINEKQISFDKKLITSQLKQSKNIPKQINTTEQEKPHTHISLLNPQKQQIE